MRRPLLLLGLLAAMLAAALALELRDTAPEDAGTQAAGNHADRSADAAPAAVAEAASPERTASLVAAILARPLFEQDRRPVAETQAGPVADGDARLAGIMISPDGRAAIFAPADGGRPTVLREGAALGALTVRAIAPGAVTVLSHGKEQVMHPSFAASSATTTPVPQLPSTPFSFGQGALATRPPGLTPQPGFTTSFAVPAAPPNLLGPAPAQPPPESRP
ncbi:MAG: hypothetical protein ACRYG6_13865 [Janthinobacterium lividum]